MELRTVDSLEGAREKLLRAADGKVPKVERVRFTEGLGRILAEDIVAKEPVPAFRKSTVDGYAVIAQNTQGVTESIPVFLEVIETVSIGTPPRKTLRAGQAVYVPTGGMVPEGADAMVMVEYCESFDDTSIAVYDAVSPGRNVIAVGEDVAEGQVLLKRGTRLRPQEIGVLASSGILEVPVYCPWKVAVISTGDELVDAGDPPELAQTRDINTYSVSATSRQYGLEVVEQHVLKDDMALLEQTIAAAMQDCDLIAVSGGSSQGERDFTADVLNRLSGGGVFTHGIALKPGKPTILGYDQNTESILMGLPGHPAAAMLVYRLYALWLYRMLTGQEPEVKTFARITENVAAAGGKSTCLLVRLRIGNDGFYEAVPVFGKSGLMTTLTEADGYTIIDMNAEGLQAGQLITVAVL